MAYFLLAESNFVSNRETKYQGRKGFSDFFRWLLRKHFIFLYLSRKQHMNRTVLSPCVVVEVDLFYCHHCDLEELLTSENCLADVPSK